MFIYLYFSLTASYILYNVLINQALTVASFGNAFFNKTSSDIKNKVKISKDVFYDVEVKYRKNILKKPAEIEEYIRKKYLEKYDVAIISETGVIVDTTSTHEKNLDLLQFPDAKKSFDEAKKTGQLLVDYPVINSDFKNFYIYLLKYIPEKKVYLQLGYKIIIFSEVVTSLTTMNLESNYYFDYTVFYVYLEKDFMSVRLFGKHENIDKENIKDILKKPDKTLLLKSFNDIKLLSTIGQNKGFSIIYLLHVKPLSKNFIIGWLTLNIAMLLLVGILYKKFTFMIRKNIETPLKEMKHNLNYSKPFYYMGDIIELKDLAETYKYHLEKTKTRDFLKEVLSAQERERERIARDVHDIVIQNLNYILIKLKQKGEDELSEILKSQIQELRKMVIDSDVVIFKNVGLERYFDMFITECSNKYSQIKFYFENNFEHFNKLDQDMQINILRIVRELVTNAIKHSKCKKIVLKFYESNSFFCINVIDDGVGFNFDNIDSNKNFGIFSVRERVFILNGKIDINSNAGGTVVSIEVPFK